MIDKDLVKQRFSSAIAHYDKEASPQRLVAERIDALLQEHADLPSGLVFEVGCGTGLLSERLWRRYGTAHPMIFNDISPDMEAPLREKVGAEPHFVASDSETSEWDDSCALIAAASCIQWWHEPAHFFTKSHRHLKEGGFVAFGTYGERNLHELREVTGKGLTYDTLTTVSERLAELGFRDIHVEETTHTLHFPDLVSLLRHLKLTGVNAIASTTPWTPKMLMETEALFRKQFATPEGLLPLSYHAVIGIARK